MVHRDLDSLGFGSSLFTELLGIYSIVYLVQNIHQRNVIWSGSLFLESLTSIVLYRMHNKAQEILGYFMSSRSYLVNSRIFQELQESSK
jgi:hypothetical protein